MSDTARYIYILNTVVFPYKILGIPVTSIDYESLLPTYIIRARKRLITRRFVKQWFSVGIHSCVRPSETSVEPIPSGYREDAYDGHVYFTHYDLQYIVYIIIVIET